MKIEEVEYKSWKDYKSYESLLEGLVGKHIVEVRGLEKGSEEVYIITDTGFVVKFYHYQDCCESVSLTDYETELDINDIRNNPPLIISAEESSNQRETDYDRETWTFYKIETNKGGIWMRWHGESNGFYSESVDLKEYYVVGG